MSSYLLIALFALFAVIGAILLAFIAIGLSGRSPSEVGPASVSLNCPHCGAETPAHEPECRACHRSFRDESTATRPVLDAPRLNRNIH